MTAVRSLALVALISAPALAATSWSQPAGSQTNFSYSNGQSANGNFGDPTVGGNSFLFSPSELSAQSNGSPASTTDTASVNLTTASGYSLSSVHARLSGDYSILDNGAFPALVAPTIVGGTFVTATGSLTLTNTVTHAVLTQAFNFGALTNEDGIFSNTVTINLPAGWKSAKVDLTATASASAEPGSASFVQFKSGNISVDTQQVAAVPLPPALLAAIPGALLAFGAARRMRRA